MAARQHGQSSRRDELRRRAALLEEAARKEAWKAPLPKDPVNTDSPESVEWAVSHMYAPRVLDLAEAAQRRIAAGQWGAARTLILEADLEVKNADDLFSRLLLHRVIAEKNALEDQALDARKQKAASARTAAEAKQAKVDALRADVLQQANEILGRHPKITRSAIAKHLAARRDEDGAAFPVSERTIRRYLGVRKFGVRPETT